MIISAIDLCLFMRVFCLFIFSFLFCFIYFILFYFFGSCQFRWPWPYFKVGATPERSNWKLYWFSRDVLIRVNWNVFFYGWYIHGQDRAQHVLSWLWCVLRKITDGFLRAVSRNNSIKVGPFLWDRNGEIFETLRNDNLHWAVHVSTSFCDFDLLSRCG